MAKGVANQDNKKPNQFLAVISVIVKYMFYGFVLLKDTSLLSTLDRFVSDPDGWLARQRRGLAIIGISLLAISGASLYGAYLTVKKITPPSNVVYFSESNNNVAKLVKKFKAADKADTLVSEYFAALTTKRSSKIQAAVAGMLLIIPILLGLFIEQIYKLRAKTQELENVLKAANVYPSEGKSRVCLATPIGYYIDCTGHSAASIATNEAIWKRLSVEIDDKGYTENPKANTMVFFKLKFGLKDLYYFDKKI